MESITSLSCGVGGRAILIFLWSWCMCSSYRLSPHSWPVMRRCVSCGVGLQLQFSPASTQIPCMGICICIQPLLAPPHTGRSIKIIPAMASWFSRHWVELWFFVSTVHDAKMFNKTIIAQVRVEGEFAMGETESRIICLTLEWWPSDI